MAVRKKNVLQSLTALAFAAIMALALTYSPLEARGCEIECQYNGYACGDPGQANCDNGSEEDSCYGTIDCIYVSRWCGGACGVN